MPYFVDSPVGANREPESESVMIRRAYCAIRRKAISRDRAASRYTGNRFKADELGTAHAALAQARKEFAEKRFRYAWPGIWSSLGGSDGAPFAAYGEKACRWFENPESKGLRLVGLAHEIGEAGHSHCRDAVEHTGWYLDSAGCGETVAGVVYQLPGKDGKARYLAGYADPWNPGTAMLSLDIIEGERKDSDWESDPALRDAARYADRIAESMAEETREYDDAWRRGREARELATEAAEACRAWVAEIRALRDIWQARRHVNRDTVRLHVENTREACNEFRRLLKRSRRNRDESEPSRNDPNRDAWREGYANG